MDIQQIYSRIAGWTMAAALIVGGAGLGGCASGNGGYVSMPQPAGVASAPGGAAENKVVGVYEGTTLAYCNTSTPSRCNAQQIVRLTFIQEDAGLTGHYRCSYGTMNCYNMNESGKIVKASVNGNQLTARVQMPDGTSCLFTARTADNNFNGGYSCYGGGSLIESGSWRGRRVY